MKLLTTQEYNLRQLEKTRQSAESGKAHKAAETLKDRAANRPKFLKP